MFIYPIYYHNWRKISTVYTHTHTHIYIYKTRLASKELFSPSNKIHGKVGWAKDLSAPPVTTQTLTELENNQLQSRRH
jgi:peptide methionine sulfoxide reductase MsrB